jgi:hypothetical protein
MTKAEKAQSKINEAVDNHIADLQPWDAILVLEGVIDDTKMKLEGLKEEQEDQD